MNYYRILILTQGVSMLGSEAVSFALPIYFFQTGHGTMDVGIALAISYLPKFIFGPFAGYLVDRFSNKRILIYTNSIQAFISILFVGTFLFLQGSFFLYLLLLLNSCFSTLHQPALQTIVTKLVDKKDLSRANGLFSFMESLSAIGGPLVAGVILQMTDLLGVFLFDMVTFFIAILGIIQLKIQLPSLLSNATDLPNINIFQEIGKGFVLLKSLPGMLGIWILTSLVNLLLAVCITLIYPLVLMQKEGGVITLSIIQALSGSVQIFGGIILSVWKGPDSLYNALLRCILLLSLGSFLIGFTQNVFLIGFGFISLSFLTPFMNNYNRTIWAVVIPQHFLGRMNAIRRAGSSFGAFIGFIGAAGLSNQVIHISGPMGFSKYQVVFLTVGLLFIFIAMVGLFFQNPLHHEYSS